MQKQNRQAFSENCIKLINCQWNSNEGLRNLALELSVAISVPKTQIYFSKVGWGISPNLCITYLQDVINKALFITVKL